MKSPDCIILGSGLAGLACSITLHRQGLSVLLIDPLSQVGGKVITHELNSGALIDEGFQVLLNSSLRSGRLAAEFVLNQLNKNPITK